MSARDGQEPFEELARFRSAANGEKIDELNEEPRPSSARPLDHIRKARQPRNEAIVADAQQRPLGKSLTPVASTTIAPGRPFAKRSYQARIASETNPSSVARHGTMTGTQVRCSTLSRPIERGEKSSERSASSRVGICPRELSKRMRSDGRHISASRLRTGHDCDGLNLYLGAVFHKSGDLNCGHRRKVTTDDRAIGFADGATIAEVVALVGEVPSH